MFEKDLNDAAYRLVTICNEKNLLVTSAESCTGGMVGAAITTIVGSSSVYERGFITYSILSKIEMLEVSANIIKKYEVVSPQVAEAMAKGALKHSKANLSVAITGIAGPGGETNTHAIGYVCISACSASSTNTQEYNFIGDREMVRYQSSIKALEMLIELANLEA